MTVKEWKQQNPDTTHTRVWAADSFGGFGNKGDSVYGDADSCEIISIDKTPGGLLRLHLWHTALWGPCPTSTTYNVRYCGDLYDEEFDSLADARRRAKALIDTGEDDVHIVRIDAA